MSTTKITDLTAYTDPVNTDVLPIVDVTSDVTKKVSIANVMKNASLGSAAAPGISFDGDPNTGIYSPGANQVAISTDGTARLTAGTTAITAAIPVDVLLGSASTPSYTFTGDLNTGIYSPGADQVAISTNGVGRVFIDASGNVKLGSSAASGFRLAVDGDTWFGNAAGTEIGRLFNDAGVLCLRASSNVTGLGFATNSSSTHAIRIDSSGRVGLGTSSPDATLHISKALSDGDTLLRIQPTSFSAGFSVRQAFTRGSTDLVRFTVTSDASNADKGSLTISTSSTTSTTNPVAVFTGDGRVGVGTTTPTATLDCNGSIRAISASPVIPSSGAGLEIYYASGTFNGTPSAYLLSYDRTGTVYKPINIDASEQVFRTSGSEKMRLTSTGLGIGTSSPSNLFHVSGTSGTPAVFERTSATGAFIALKDSASQTFIGNTNGVFSIQTPGSSYSDKLVITSAGAVGIGTTSPSARLHVNGTNAGFILQHAGNSSYSALYTDTNNTLQFVVGGGPSEAARFDASGRFLVGTSSAASTDNNANSPNVQLEGADGDASRVLIRSNAGTTATAGPILYLARSRGTTANSKTAVAQDDFLGSIVFEGTDGVYDRRAASITAFVDGTPGADDMPGRIVLSTSADGASSPTERLRLNSNGQLCINTTTATTGIGHRVFIEDGTTYAPMGVNNAAGGSGSSNNIVIYRAGTQVGSITTTNTATAYNTSSDYRLKENIVEVTDGITRLQQLKPSRFNFIGDADRTVDGFIAHEVQDVVPEAVHGAKDEVDENGNPIYQGIDQSKLVPLLTAALQEAIGEIESLKARVAALESA